jgi:hypothetical protein
LTAHHLLICGEHSFGRTISFDGSAADSSESDSAVFPELTPRNWQKGHKADVSHFVSKHRDLGATQPSAKDSALNTIVEAG